MTHEQVMAIGLFALSAGYIARKTPYFDVWSGVLCLMGMYQAGSFG